jgi:hypothetical protein
MSVEWGRTHQTASVEAMPLAKDHSPSLVVLMIIEHQFA